jgi:DnaJ-class molecular chaperone
MMTRKKPNDYYDILHVPKNASLEDIKRAYREAALRHHPDRVPQEKKAEAEEKFKEISEAYAILSDPQKRALYDQKGHAGINQTYTNEDIFQGADFSSIFSDLSDYGFEESLFERLFGGTGHDFFGHQRRGRAKTQDLEVSLEITLEQAYHGWEPSLSIPGIITCPHCSGMGIEKNKQSTPCHSCQGAGRITTHRQLKVKIPPGVKANSTLRLKGEGGEGGDLYISIQEKEHPVFKRKGDDLHIEHSIPLTVALLGGKVQVPTLSGQVTMTIPSGTQNGAQLRLREKGMPHLSNPQIHGDEIVHIHVTIPTSLTAEQRDLIERLAAIL